MFILLFSISIDSILAENGIYSPGFEWNRAWSRFPSPEDMPFILPFFIDLYRKPLYVHRFTLSKANTIEHYLSDSIMSKNRNSIYNILNLIGVDMMVEGFRNYGANLSEKKIDLYSAIKMVYSTGNGQMNTITFGGAYPDTENPIRKRIEKVPLKIRGVLSNLIYNTLDGYMWIEKSWRNLPAGTKEKILLEKDLDMTISDGSKYYPEIDDAEKFTDHASFYYGAMKVASAVEKAGFELKNLNVKLKEDIIFETPLGEIALLGIKSGKYSFNNPFIIIDFGGNDTYKGRVGANSFINPVSVIIELGGNDKYVSNDTLIPTQGSGICGVGVLLDMSGNDEYTGGKQSQGYGFFGVGILADLSGSDRYKGWTQTQGCGYRGIGMLLDAEGDDEYRSYGNSQGDGEIGGIGLLADRQGNDFYYAEPYSSVYDRGDYHSKHRINSNNSQGFGGGRRADGSDGHSWAGGLGMLIDISGNDRYVSGNWSLGTGYWFGTGILYDGGGNDHYRSCYFTQGSGAHFCIGALIDENGNDKHELFETAGAALGFGWDWTFAYFYDGGGNDKYNMKKISIGVAEIRSIALFIEAGGDDEYRISDHGLRLGACDKRNSYYEPSKISPYHFYGKNYGVFLDLGGNDKYSVEFFKNNKKWYQPENDLVNIRANNIGIGIDTALTPSP